MPFVWMAQRGVIGCRAKSVFIDTRLIRRVGIHEYASYMTIAGRKMEFRWVRGFVSLVRTIPIGRCGIVNPIGHVLRGTSSDLFSTAVFIEQQRQGKIAVSASEFKTLPSEFARDRLSRDATRRMTRQAHPIGFRDTLSEPETKFTSPLWRRLCMRSPINAPTSAVSPSFP